MCPPSEVTQLQGYVEDARRLLNTAKSQHLMQLEEIRYLALVHPLTLPHTSHPLTFPLSPPHSHIPSHPHSHTLTPHTRGEEVKYQVEVREEMAQLETALASTKRDYEMLRIEFEKTVASNEQAAPIAKELQVVKSLVRTSLESDQLD